MDDAAFLEALTEELAGLTGVRSVALGGSRSAGTHTPASDWDLAVYYRDCFDPGELRALGHPGEVSELGGWGGGVFNGGGWLIVDGRRVDVHYRDLAVVERVQAEAESGVFQVERLGFHLAGIPSYLLLAELAVNRTLSGELPRPRYPEELRRRARERWATDARLHIGYARDAHARAGRVAQTVAMATVAASMAAHAVLAGRGEWVTNEKRLFALAGITGLDDAVTELAGDPIVFCARVEELIEAALGG